MCGGFMEQMDTVMAEMSFPVMHLATTIVS